MSVISGKTNAGLVKYATAQLGLPYWYGTFGQIANEALFNSKAKQYKSTGYYTKWKDYPKQYGKRVHDCVGLIKAYMWADPATGIYSSKNYKSSQDKSAYGMYAASSMKGSISNFPKRKGQLVYKSTSKSDAKKIHHVGVYIGDGYVIEAKGHEEGVVRTKFDNAGWTHWSQCPYIKDESESTGGLWYSKDREGIYVITGKTVYLRKDAGAVEKILGVMRKGEEVECNGYYKRIGQTDWLKVNATIEKKKVLGFMSKKYLERIVEK